MALEKEWSLKEPTRSVSSESVTNSLDTTTKLYKINRERHIFLGNEAEIQQHFVAFASPSSSQIWKIY